MLGGVRGLPFCSNARFHSCIIADALSAPDGMSVCVTVELGLYKQPSRNHGVSELHVECGLGSRIFQPQI